jgi:hypothetical protein
MSDTLDNVKRRRNSKEDKEDRFNKRIEVALDASASSNHNPVPKSIFFTQIPQPDLTLQIANFFYSIIESQTFKTTIDALKQKDYVVNVEVEVRLSKER